MTLYAKIVTAIVTIAVIAAMLTGNCWFLVPAVLAVVVVEHLRRQLHL